MEPGAPPKPLVVKTSFGWVLFEVVLLAGAVLLVDYLRGPHPWLMAALMIFPLIVAIRGFGDNGARLVVDAKGLTWRATRYGATSRAAWADIASAEIVSPPGNAPYALHLVLAGGQVVLSVAAGRTRVVDVSLDNIDTDFKNLRRAIHAHEPRFFTDPKERGE